MAVFYEVATLNDPIDGPPFAVIQIDTDKQIGSGVESVVVSLHWTKSEAQDAAANARLIAVAPDMKAAITGLLDQFGGYVCPEIDAAITVMQKIGADRWSMQAQIEAEEERRRLENEEMEKHFREHPHG